MLNEQDKILHAKLNMETAKMPWRDLERFFASGSLIYVSDGLDLVEVGVKFANDEKSVVEKWLNEGRIAKVSDEQAKNWHETNVSLWTVVVRPWILVQEQHYTTH